MASSNDILFALSNRRFAPFVVTLSGAVSQASALALGAITNNDSGIAGMTWNPYVLPVRALGKCGGYDSDIMAGMRWAAGLTVTDARQKLLDYGRPALQYVRENSTPALASASHSALLGSFSRMVRRSL